MEIYCWFGYNMMKTQCTINDGKLKCLSESSFSVKTEWRLDFRNFNMQERFPSSAEEMQQQPASLAYKCGTAHLRVDSAFPLAPRVSGCASELEQCRDVRGLNWLKRPYRGAKGHIWLALQIVLASGCSLKPGISSQTAVNHVQSTQACNLCRFGIHHRSHMGV